MENQTYILFTSLSYILHQTNWLSEEIKRSYSYFCLSPSFLSSNINSQPFINSDLFKRCHKLHVFISFPCLCSTALFRNPRISLRVTSPLHQSSSSPLCLFQLCSEPWVRCLGGGEGYWSNKLVFGQNGALHNITLHVATNWLLLAWHYRKRLLHL